MLQKILGPIIDQILNRIGLEKRLDDLQAKGIAELEETRDEALRMVADKLDAFMKELPAVGAAFAESTVQTVFEHTQVDEAANQVSGVVTGILARLPFGLGRP
jgi:hypothetical protein